MAPSVNSSCAPRGPRNLSRPSRKMRLRWANSISTRLRLRRDCSNAGVPTRARARSRASSWMLVTNWWEAGFYLPFAVTGTGEFLSDGAKIRSLFVVPDAGKRDFFYGVNFELGYEMPQFAPTPWALEIRPIIGVRNKEWEFIVNPIVDISFGPGGEADFAPAARLARNLGEDRFIGLEYYSDYGKIGNILPLPQQSQQLYAVADFKVKDVDVELGAGCGFTPGSDRLIFKAIISYAFPVPGKNNDAGAALSSMTMGTQPRSAPIPCLRNRIFPSPRNLKGDVA